LAFDQAFEFLMDHEDKTRSGQVTTDSGGLTRWGISHKAYPALDIKNLSYEDARDIYHSDYWCSEYDAMPQGVANKVMDCAVNMGKKRAHILLQCALQDCGEPVVADGKLGPATMGAVKRSEPMHLLVSLREHCCKFYEELVRRNPAKYERYLAGWLRRARS
jgi:lysozyme family protein